MKIKILLILSIIFSCQFSMAQNKSATQYILIRGQVTNKSENSWSFTKTGYFDSEIINVLIQKDGTFNIKVPIEGVQDISFLDGIYLYAQPSDTIEINWDGKNFEKTIEVKSPSSSRNRDFQTNLRLWKEFRQSEISLFQLLSDGKEESDLDKFKLINDQFNKQLKLVISNPSMTTEKFVYQIYYKHINLLMGKKLLKKYTLTFDSKVLKPTELQIVKRYLPENFSYNELNNKIFYLSPVYRDFIFQYLQFPERLLKSGPTTNLVVMRNSRGEAMTIPYTQTRFYNAKNDIPSDAPIWDNYYTGLSQINQIPIREWFITKSIFFGFRHYRFNEAESVLIDFMPKCQTEVYRDTLKSYYTFIQRFKQGKSAPNFSLKDQNGKTVTLNDFKGKIVYLNFWGVHCSASTADIQSFYPSALEKYKGRDVVFINICVDENETNWKKALSENKLGGINLFADKGFASKVCKDYYFFATPSYIIIDKHGNFLEYNAPHPFESNFYPILDKSIMNK
jgi:peroxiredoxin